MGKIVYHGTFSDEPPHEYGHETFHAGTVRATEDRAADQMMGGEVEEPAIRRLHAYEISDDAPMSKRVWDDPMEGMFGASEKARPAPEFKENRIYPYKNIREDKGSTSYVIPSDFVGNHVKHLGVQFQGFYGSDEQEKAVMDAITTMSGGKVRK
jgi:hypothetical protein